MKIIILSLFSLSWLKWNMFIDRNSFSDERCDPWASGFFFIQFAVLIIVLSNLNCFLRWVLWPMGLYLTVDVHYAWCIYPHSNIHLCVLGDSTESTCWKDFWSCQGRNCSVCFHQNPPSIPAGFPRNGFQDIVSR